MTETYQPSADVQALDRLVGTWKITGGAEGTVRYEWMPGGFFLLQHVDLTQFGQPVTGLEVIGNLRPFGEPAGTDVVSRFFDSTGNTLDYVYELTGDKLTIWGGAKGSPPLRGHVQRRRHHRHRGLGLPGRSGYESTHDPDLTHRDDLGAPAGGPVPEHGSIEPPIAGAAPDDGSPGEGELRDTPSRHWKRLGMPVECEYQMVCLRAATQ